MHRITGTVQVRCLVHCRKCGEVELGSIGFEPDELKEVVERVGVGTSFPIGWGKYYNPQGDEFQCPQCNGMQV